MYKRFLIALPVAAIVVIGIFLVMKSLTLHERPATVFRFQIAQGTPGTSPVPRPDPLLRAQEPSGGGLDDRSLYEPCTSPYAHIPKLGPVTEVGRGDYAVVKYRLNPDGTTRDIRVVAASKARLGDRAVELVTRLRVKPECVQDMLSDFDGEFARLRIEFAVE